MGGGTCAMVADAVARQRYMWKQMMAHRMPRIKLKPGQDTRDPNQGLDSESWEAYDCLLLCLSCGYLAEDDGEPCPGCGGTSWVDLRRTVDAEAIRQMERRNRATVPPRIQFWGHGLSAVVGVLTAVGLGAVLWHSEYSTDIEAVVIALVVGAFMGGVAAWLLPKALVFLTYRRRPTYPLRWRLPLPLPNTRGSPARTLQGPLTPTGPLLRAPVSGRECIGYEVRLLFDTVGDARPPMWILEEERIGGFELGGERFAADSATLQLANHLVESEDDSFDDSAVTRFLRKRGLFASEGEYTIFEAIVEPDQPYRLETFGRPEGAVPRIREAA